MAKAQLTWVCLVVPWLFACHGSITFTGTLEDPDGGPPGFPDAKTANPDGPGPTPDAAPGTPDAAPAVDAPIAHNYKCTALGTAYTDGFFSMRGFQGKIYGGLFGYGHEAQSMVYRHPSFELTSPGLLGIGESVCAMREFDGYLYAATENSGHLYRTADGSNWTRVRNGYGGGIACGLAVHNGYIYAVIYNFAAMTNGQVVRSQDGTNWTVLYDSGSLALRLKDIISYQGVVYAFGDNQKTGELHMLVSTDGTNFSLKSAPARFYRSYVWNGLMYLGSTSKSANNTSTAGVWRWDGTGQPTKVYASDKRYVTELVGWDGVISAGTSEGFKDTDGQAALLMSREGTNWQAVCNFGDRAVWSIAVANNQLYAGSWEWNGHGQLYRVDIVP